jgi:hypothetical protein
MKNNLGKMQRLLEEATAAGDAPADKLDPETAPLREAWLAFGEMIEAAQPPSVNYPLPLEEGPGVRTVHSHSRRRLLAAGLAASLLAGLVTVWMLYGPNRQENPAPTTETMAATDRPVASSVHENAKSEATADEPQWDDKLDEQFAQVGWQMTCVRQNQTFRTDAFGLVQYRVEQFSKAIQADSL